MYIYIYIFTRNLSLSLYLSLSIYIYIHTYVRAICVYINSILVCANCTFATVNLTLDADIPGYTAMHGHCIVTILWNTRRGLFGRSGRESPSSPSKQEASVNVHIR